MTIRFHGADEVPYGCFSTFSPHGIELDGAYWPAVEHWYQAQRFSGGRQAERIRRADSPLRAAALGRDPAAPLRRDWHKARDEVMRRGVEAKFRTHEDIRAILLATGGDELVEDTFDDGHWGCGRNGTGRNLLGRILMRTRSRLAAEQPPTATPPDGAPGRNPDVHDRPPG